MSLQSYLHVIFVAICKMRVWSQSTFCSPNDRHLWLLLAICYLSRKGQGCGIIFVVLLELHTGMFAQFYFLWYLLGSLKLSQAALSSWLLTSHRYFPTSVPYLAPLWHLFSGVGSFSLVWLPDSFQDNCKVPHQRVSLSLVFCHLGTPIGNDENAGKNKIFYF